MLELSSFQLDDARERFEPDAAAVLNVTQDHLDWHGSMAAYAAAKARIFGARGAHGRQPRRSRRRCAMRARRRRRCRRAKGARRRPSRARRHASASTRRARAGDFGLVVENGMAWLVRARRPTRRERGATSRRDRPAAADAGRRAAHPRPPQRRQRAGGARAGQRDRLPLAPMLHGLREYRGEPHRVELVASVGGVEYFDDSKGTNVGATVAALDGLGAERRRPSSS